MKFAKIFMAIAVVCLAVACASPEKQVEKAREHAAKQEWVDAAEALAKIDPADMAEEAVNETPIAKEAATIILAIGFSGDQEAYDITDKWWKEVEAEKKKLEKE